MDAFEFTDTMNEITGVGGLEERACRAAVRAGAAWWAAHPQAQPVIEGNPSPAAGVTGTNPAGCALVAAIQSVPFTRDDGTRVRLGDCMTSGLYYASLHHLMFIGTFGWPAYVDIMSEPLTLMPASQRT
jgi:hypothetical protein